MTPRDISELQRILDQDEIDVMNVGQVVRDYAKLRKITVKLLHEIARLQRAEASLTHPAPATRAGEKVKA